MAVVVSRLLSAGNLAAREVPHEIESLANGQEFIASSYEWDFEYFPLKLKPNTEPVIQKDVNEESRSRIADLFLEDRDTHLVTGSATFDAISGRLRIEAKQSVAASDGTTQTSSFAWAYDGEIYSNLETINLSPAAVEATGSKDLKRGLIQTQLGQPDNLNVFLIQSGLCFFPQFAPQVAGTSVRYLPLTHRLSYLRTLSEIHETLPTSLGTDLTGVTYIIQMSPMVHGGKTYQRTTASTFLFDKSKGGALAWMLDHAPGRIAEATNWTDVKSTETTSGVWLPSVVTRISALSGIGERTVIKNLRVNKEFADGIFNLSMPKGSVVRDEVAEMSYTVTDGPVSESAAIDAYLKSNQIQITEPRQTAGRITVTSILIGVNVIALTLIIIYLLRRRKSSRIAVLIVFAIPHSCLSADNKLAWNGGWELSHVGTNPTRISQCGFNVAATALKLFNVRFDPIALAVDLKPTQKGIQASDLLRTLRELGLSVEARKGVSLKSVSDTLPEGKIAIVAIQWPGSGNAHYVILARLRDGEVYVLDPPQRVFLATSLNVDTLDENRDTVVLFVAKSNASREPRDCDALSFDRTVVFPSDEVDMRPIEETVEIRNTSSREVRIKRVTSSCSCVRVSGNTAGPIPPNENVSLSLNITWEAVNSGGIEVFVLCDDGSSAKIRVIHPDDYRPSPDFARFSDSRNLRIPVEIRDFRDIDLHFTYKIPAEYRRISGHLSANSSKQWCVAKIREATDDSKSAGSLEVRVLPTENLIAELGRQQSYQAVVRVFRGDNEAEQIGEMSVNVHRDIVAIAAPCVLSRGESSGTTTLKIIRSGWILQTIAVADNRVEGDFSFDPLSESDWRVSFTGGTEDSTSCTAIATCTLVHVDSTVSPIQMPLILVVN